METRIIEALRREGKPMEPDALLSGFEENERDKAAAGIADMLADGRLLLTRKRKLALPEQTGLTYGRIQGNARGFGFFIPEDGAQDMFIPAEGMHGAMNGDKVWVRETQQVSRGGNPEAEVALIALRATKRVVGSFDADSRGGFVVPDDAKLYMDMLVQAADTASAKSGDKVVAEVLQYPDGRRPLTGRIVEVLGAKSDVGTDILSIIRRLELPDSFSKASIKLAKSLDKPVEADDVARREDLRGLLTITVDGADARDLDDAVSLTRLKDGFMLGVHIADVSNYVQEGSPLDKDAYQRGTSVYFPDRVLPMLPKEISNGVCSLNEGTDKLTLSCMMEIDNTGRVKHHRIAETVIRTRHRMTYDDVNAMLAGDEALLQKYADIVPVLGDMKALMELLNARRVKRGSIDFDLDEAKIVLDKQGKPTEVSVYERGIANRMIEEFMLIANETVAQHVQDMGMPFMYRVHETPDKEKLAELNAFLGTLGYGLKNVTNIRPAALQRVLVACKGTKEENVISRVTLRSLKRARYSETCLGHFGLAAESYCHFTSPIRRYPDLVVHRILKELLHGVLGAKRVEEWTARLPEMAKQCSDREKVATEAERAADDMKKCEFMKDRIGTVELGLISGVAQYGFFVQLGNTVEGMVRVASIEGDYYTCDEKNYRMVGRASGRVFRLGDEVKVKVVAVDLESRTVDFELAEGQKPAQSSQGKSGGRGRGRSGKAKAGAPSAKNGGTSGGQSAKTGNKGKTGGKPAAKPAPQVEKKAAK